jgi:hypothetical protein
MEAAAKFYINEGLAGSGDFTGIVGGTKIDSAKTDEGGNLHVTVNGTTTSHAPRTSDYGVYYLVDVGNGSFLATIGLSMKEKRPYIKFKAGQKKTEARVPERQFYGAADKQS